MEATKGIFSDNNNNQTFPTRPTLEQGVAGNEGVRTAESITALEFVPTDESHTEVVGEQTSESPTHKNPVTNGQSAETPGTC